MLLESFGGSALMALPDVMIIPGGIPRGASVNDPVGGPLLKFAPGVIVTLITLMPCEPSAAASACGSLVGTIVRAEAAGAARSSAIALPSAGSARDRGPSGASL